MIDTVEKLVEALGGNRATSAVCGVGDPAVCNWKANGRIPARYYLALTKALKAGRKGAPSPELFFDTIAAE